MKRLAFWLKLHWSLFLRAQLTKTQHWFRWWLGAEQATIHHLNQCWLNSLTHICDTSWRWVNSLRSRRKRPHSLDNIFKWIFLNENIWIWIEISLKFVPKGPINNILALDKIMPLFEPMMASLLTHMCVTGTQRVNNVHSSVWWIAGIPDDTFLVVKHPLKDLMIFQIRICYIIRQSREYTLTWPIWFFSLDSVAEDKIWQVNLF